MKAFVLGVVRGYDRFVLGTDDVFLVVIAFELLAVVTRVVFGRDVSVRVKVYFGIFQLLTGMFQLHRVVSGSFVFVFLI